VAEMFRTQITPRVSETDGVGHINNTVIPIWFEAGRNEIFRLFTPDLSFKDWRAIIVKVSVDYTSQIYYGNDVEVLTYVERIGNSSYTLYEELYQGERLCAKSTATYINFNLALQKSEKIPQTVREQLAMHLYIKDEVQS
jgi:acyl-CoA thioester hydrolase